MEILNKCLLRLNIASWRRFQFTPHLILVFVLALSACGHQPSASAISDLELIKTRKTIRAGWAPYPPYAERDLNTGKIQGLYIELFDKVTDEAGLRVTFVETTWTTMVADLKTGKFDVMVAPVFRTIPRALEVAFTRPIGYFGLSALERAGEIRYSKLDDFNNGSVRVSTVAGEVGYDFARTHLPKATLVVHRSGDISVALVDVIEGRADVAITDAWTIKQFAAAHPNRVRDMFANHPFDMVGAGWFVRIGSQDFLNFLDSSIDWLGSSGSLSDTATKYNLPSPPDLVGNR